MWRRYDTVPCRVGCLLVGTTVATRYSFQAHHAPEAALQLFQQHVLAAYGRAPIRLFADNIVEQVGLELGVARQACG